MIDDITATERYPRDTAITALAAAIIIGVITTSKLGKRIEALEKAQREIRVTR